MDPAALRNVQLDSGDANDADVDVALVARRLVDKAGAVQFNPDDLPTTSRALAAARGDLPEAGPIIGDELLDVAQVVSGSKRAVRLSLASLRYWMSGQFGVCLHSTGENADPAQTRILLETVDASPTNPYLLYFDQLILTAFTGPGQFDLVERDASDVDITFFDCITETDSPLLTSVDDDFTEDMVDRLVTCVGIPDGTTVLSYQNPKQLTLSADATEDAPDPGIRCTIGGESRVTLATKAGFADGDTTGGWSRFAKAVMSDKIYSVVFVPGTAGDGIYSLKLRGLSQEQC